MLVLEVNVETLSWFVQNNALVRHLDGLISNLREAGTQPFNKAYMNKVQQAVGHHSVRTLLDLEASLSNDQGDYTDFLHAYVRRPRAIRRSTPVGYSVELYAEYLALRPPNGNVLKLATYYEAVHAWPPEAAYDIANQLRVELGERWRG